MEEKSIKIGKKRFVLENGKLCNAQTKEEVKDLPYLFFKNYPAQEFVVVDNRLFQWFDDDRKIRELPLIFLCKDNNFSYFYSDNPGKEHGEGRFVIAFKENRIFLIGRAFMQIHDNLYKIGRYAYQIVDGHLEKLCECLNFEKIDVRVEISAGENGMSEMQAFKKVGQRWKKVTHWRPGHIVPSQKSNPKK